MVHNLHSSVDYVLIIKEIIQERWIKNILALFETQATLSASESNKKFTENFVSRTCPSASVTILLLFPNSFTFIVCVGEDKDLTVEENSHTIFNAVGEIMDVGVLFSTILNLNNESKNNKKNGNKIEEIRVANNSR